MARSILVGALQKLPANGQMLRRPLPGTWTPLTLVSPHSLYLTTITTIHSSLISDLLSVQWYSTAPHQEARAQCRPGLVFGTLASSLGVPTTTLDQILSTHRL